LKLCVVNFWNGAFDGDFFDFFFRSCFPDVVYTDNQHDADLVVTSVFGHTQTDPSKTLAYIGENIRPNFIGYNHSLSFDWDSYGGRTYRLPLWYARLAWDGFEHDNHQNHGYEELISIKQLMQPRKLDMSTKKEFCALIANNPEGLRINLYNSISDYKTVHGYGKMFRNPLRQSKFALLPDYKFCLCPENSTYDGYITEKLIDAYAGGTVPIYSGDISVADDFNEGAYLNYQFARDMEYFVRKVKLWDEDLEIYQQTYEQPLLKKEPKLDDAIAFVRSLVK
jgi:hypothetical protein